MGNSQQMKDAIAYAQREIGGEGWKDADLRVVMLAGFGYLADEVRAAGFTIRIRGRGAFGVGILLGGAAIGALLRFLGG